MSIKKLYNTRKNRLVILGLIFSIIIVSVLAYVYYTFNKSKDHVKNDIPTYLESKRNTMLNSEVVLCDFDLKKPEYVLVYEAKYKSSENKYYEAFFYEMSRGNVFSQDWEYKNGGATHISDTTFSQLVSLVKDDCNQFKNSYPKSDNPRKDSLPDDIYWTYYPPLTEDELEMQEQFEEEANQEKELEEELDKIFRNYGYSFAEIFEITDGAEFNKDEDEFNKILKGARTAKEIEPKAKQIIDFLIEKGYLEERVDN